MTSFTIYISPVTEKLETSNLDQINIERVPLGSLSQGAVMSLAHNHLTNLFISSCYDQIWAVKATR